MNGILCLDMGAWWKRTAEGYFAHLPTAAILDAVKELPLSDVHRLATMKKTEFAQDAERLVDTTGWMPEVFRPTPK